MGCSQVESRMVCGHRRAQARWEASGKEGQHQACGAALGRCQVGLWACFVTWCLPVGAGKLHQALLPSFFPFSTSVGRMSPFIPLVPHFPSCREGQQPVGIPIGKGLRKGLVILTWNNASHPSELPVPTQRRQPPLPPALGCRERRPVL